jgi:hypothetical protein
MVTYLSAVTLWLLASLHKTNTFKKASANATKCNLSYMIQFFYSLYNYIIYKVLQGLAYSMYNKLNVYVDQKAMFISAQKCTKYLTP